MIIKGLFVLFYFIILLAAANEICLFIILGGFVKREKLLEIERLAEIDVKLNRYNDNILNIGNSSELYISHFGFLPGILSYYHIGEVKDNKRNSRIPIWSKTHKKISYCYKIAKIKQEREENER